MKCSELEILICDYVDGTLSQAEKATVELHLAGCAACRALVADAAAAVEFMGRVAEVDPPPALVNHILFEARQGGRVVVRARRGWLGRLLEPVLQPRFAMGMAMTVLSFAMLARFAGIPVRQLKASDLEPARIWMAAEDKAYRSWDRVKKYYESLRLVFEIQQTLKDWSGEGASQQAIETQKDSKAEKKDAPAAEEPVDFSAPGGIGKKSHARESK